MALKDNKSTAKPADESKPPKAAVPPVQSPQPVDEEGNLIPTPEPGEPQEPADQPDPLDAKAQLDKRVEEQANQLNPDQVQEDGHWPSTEGLLAAPKTRPHTIDPATGHIIYAGEVAALPGGNVDGEGMAGD